MKICAQCNFTPLSEDGFCPECGIAFYPDDLAQIKDVAFCPVCTISPLEDDGYCDFCQKITGAEPEETDKSESKELDPVSLTKSIREIDKFLHRQWSMQKR